MRFIVLAIVPLVGLSLVQETPPKLLLAFASFRDRPKHPKVYFYEHDGDKQGKVVGSIDSVNLRSDHRPSLSLDGRWCAFASELENQTSRIFLYDMMDKKLATLPIINDSPNAQLHPSLTGDGKFVAFAAWDHKALSQRWSVALFDLTQKKMAETPGLNIQTSDQRMPGFSADGRLLAFVSNRKGGVGGADIYLFDMQEKKVVPVPELNSPGLDITPSLSQDGNLIAFASDRPGGQGGRDIQLWDRAAKKFLPLPGVNSVNDEQTPTISPDGRVLTFVSERLAGEGERDIFLYDRRTQKLLPTPGLNSKRDDFDPVIIQIK